MDRNFEKYQREKKNQIFRLIRGITEMQESVGIQE